jgi:3-hydroxyacyl-CoA dehydrogenase/enoyl-CoA hydratase/3-hydroxybutyryl-CoA epimerase
LLVDEGYTPEHIDKCAKDFGMPMGPIELADRVGLDVCLSVAEILTKELGGTIPATLYERVNRGELGIKSGKGFYQYKKGKIMRKPGKDTVQTPDMIDRLILRMLNEAVICLRQGVVEDSDLLDAGMIFGTGFAPFRGGPINYARTLGIDNVRARLSELAEKYGDRFAPDEGWDELLKVEEHPEILLKSVYYTQKSEDTASLSGT